MPGFFYAILLLTHIWEDAMTCPRKIKNPREYPIGNRLFIIGATVSNGKKERYVLMHSGEWKRVKSFKRKLLPKGYRQFSKDIPEDTHESEHIRQNNHSV